MFDQIFGIRLCKVCSHFSPYTLRTQATQHTHNTHFVWMTQAISFLLLISRSLFTFIVYPLLDAVHSTQCQCMCCRFLFIFIVLGCFSILVFISVKVVHFFDLTFLDTHYYHNRINRLKKYTHTPNKKKIIKQKNFFL